jgi:hypothetical protein
VGPDIPRNGDGQRFRMSMKLMVPSNKALTASIER